jgi:hypothetical protein
MRRAAMDKGGNQLRRAAMWTWVLLASVDVRRVPMLPRQQMSMLHGLEKITCYLL